MGTVMGMGLDWKLRDTNTLEAKSGGDMLTVQRTDVHVFEVRLGSRKPVQAATLSEAKQLAEGLASPQPSKPWAAKDVDAVADG